MGKPWAYKLKRLAGLLAALAVAAAPPAAFAAPGMLVTQNWAESAVFYSAPSDETETFRMSGEEFIGRRIALEDRLVYAYSALLRGLEGERREALEAAQKAWTDCYYAYVEALEQLWLEPVKIHFGVTGHERRTNVYRDVVLLMLTNRITDLEEWRAGRLAYFEEAAAVEKAAELAEARRQLQVDMGLCLYVIQEEYREKIMDSHRAFFEFLDRNHEFVSLMAGEGPEATAESLLQVQRMSYLTEVHYEGCRFFRREREE